MLLPLWGRAKYSVENRNILDDREAEQIIKTCGYDFTEVAKTFGEFGGICYIVRARKFDDVIRKFIEKHPYATVVNIGVGLDTTFSRVDNGSIRWYNLDLPDSITFRKTFLSDSSRNTCIAKSFLDPSWFEEVAFKPDNGILFISGGVFYYFHDKELQPLFQAMAEHFPGGELCFDAESRMALNVSNRMVRKSGNQSAMMYFSVGNAKDLEKWSPQIRLVSGEPLFQGIAVAKHWSFPVRLNVRFLCHSKMMQFVNLRFSFSRSA